MYIVAINCTEAPFQVDASGLSLMNWTEEEGNARPYNTHIEV